MVALSVLGDLVLRQARERQPAPACGCSIEEEPRELELCRTEAVYAADRIGRAETELALARKAPSPKTSDATIYPHYNSAIYALPGVIGLLGHFATYCRARRPVRRTALAVEGHESSTDDEILAARTAARTICR